MLGSDLAFCHLMDPRPRHLTRPDSIGGLAMPGFIGH